MTADPMQRARDRLAAECARINYLDTARAVREASDTSTIMVPADAALALLTREAPPHIEGAYMTLEARLRDNAMIMREKWQAARKVNDEAGASLFSQLVDDLDEAAAWCRKSFDGFAESERANLTREAEVRGEPVHSLHELEQGWQPIETAPTKHGARFLIWAAPRSGVEAAIYEAIRFNDAHGDSIRLSDKYGDPQEYGILKRATHWRESLAPPAVRGGD